jgi:hypothetical protein
MLTDGTDKIQAMPATQLNKEVIEGKIKAFSVIKLVSFQTSTVNDQKYVFLLIILMNFILISFLFRRILILLGFEAVAQLGNEVSSAGSAVQNYSAAPTAHPGYGQQQQPSVSLYQPNYGPSSVVPAAPAAASHHQQPPQQTNYPPQAPPAAAAPYGNNSYATSSAAVPLPQQQPMSSAYSSSSSSSSAMPQHQPPATNPYNSSSYSSNKPSAAPIVKDDHSNVTIVPISAINPYSSK